MTTVLDKLANQLHHEWCKNSPCYGPTKRDYDKAKELIARAEEKKA